MNRIDAYNLIEQAKVKYPKGRKFKSIVTGLVCESTGIFVFNSYGDLVTSLNRTVFNSESKKWSEIIK